MTRSASHSPLVAAVRYLVPLGLTVLLVAYMFRKVNFADMMRILGQGVDYWWILLAMGLSVVSHMVRASRWRMQLRALGIDAPYMALCCSIFGTYALNLVFPRLGEVWRCTYISRREHASFTKVLGSMVADRLSDTITVACLFLLTFIVATPAINSFLSKYPVGQDIVRIISSWWFWVAVAAGVVCLLLLFRLGRNCGPVRRVREEVRRLWQGFAVVGSMPGKGRFVLLTIGIWGCYFLQLYIAFFAFPATRALCSGPELGWGLEPCLVAWILSSIGMAVPSNGGLGPWNLGVIFGLAVYGVGTTEATAFSMLVWSSETLMLIILGIFTMAYIASGRKKNDADAAGMASKL